MAHPRVPVAKSWWREQLRITWHLPVTLAVLGAVLLGVRYWPWLTSRPPVVVRLEGSRVEVGLAHGRALADEIRATYQGYVLEGLVAQAGWSERDLLDLALHYDRHIPAPYRRQMLAVSQGAELPYEKVLLLNVLPDVILGARPSRSQPAVGEGALAACSSVAVESSEGLLVGRNLDWMGYGVAQRFGIVTVERIDGAAPVLGVGWPGLIGVISGMNEAGLVAALHTAPAVDVEPSAPPILIRLREMLETSTTVEEATAEMLSSPRTIALNLILAGGDTREALVLEMTGRRHAVVESLDGFVATTNFYQELDEPGAFGADRLATLERDLLPVENRSSAELRRSLGRVAMWGPGAGMSTLQSVVFEPERGRVSVALGADPATWGRYFAVGLEARADER